MSKNYKKKIIFILPPKNWFYGIDYTISKSIIKYFTTKNIFDVIEFKEIDIFLKKEKTAKDFLKIFFYFFNYKFKKIDYVMSINSSYILLSNFKFQKKIKNFFANFLNLKCILRWDHINEQLPNIVNNIYDKYYFKNKERIDDSRIFFFKELNHKNFLHYSSYHAKNKFFSNQNLINFTKDKYKIKFRNLSYMFMFDNLRKSNLNNNKIAIIGYVNRKNLNSKKISLGFDLIKNENNFYSIKNHVSLIEYSDYLYNIKKIKIIKNLNLNFYGLHPKKNFKLLDAYNFYKNVGDYFIIINPSNPKNLTLTSKFYNVFLCGSFCLSEMPKEIPYILQQYKKYIFYKNEEDLKYKIEFLKKNKNIYNYLKNKLYKISREYYKTETKNFQNEFLTK